MTLTTKIFNRKVSEDEERNNDAETVLKIMLKSELRIFCG